MEQPTIILVAGISCSGKTTLSQRLSEELRALHVSIDDYYRSFDSLALEEKKQIDFDTPEAVEHELLAHHLTALKAGLAIDKPIYDAAGYARVGTNRVNPHRFVVVEGLFSLYWQEVLGLADLRIFVDTPGEVCLERRLFRDTFQFNRTHEESLHRYVKQVLPNQQRYVLPTKENACLVVKGDHNLEMAVGAVKSRVFADSGELATV